MLGLGEAGGRYAADLARAGWLVRGYDPAATPTPDGVTRASTGAEAVRDAVLVLSLAGAGPAVAVAKEIAPALPDGACFADLNTTAPELKREVERVLPDRTMADVAVLAPVPHQGAATPLLASGPAAHRFATLMAGTGAPVEVLDAPVGAAAGRKLLRSVFMKGVAACVLEAVAAGAAAGCEPWVRGQIGALLGESMVDRFVTGSRTHAARRIDEVRAATAYLLELGVPTDVCEATLAWLDRLARDG